MLTRKQSELLAFIHARLEEGGVSPSFDEMKEALGLKSKSGIHRLISALEERGFIRRLPHRARALEVVRLPEASEGRSLRPAPARAPAANDVVALPLYGKIAAGAPIEGLRDATSFIEVPASMLGNGEHYALTVTGDSMVEAGILDGDTAIIRRCDTVENGSIAVALVDGSEVTLKTVRRSGPLVALEPANPSYEVRRLPPDRVRVQGRLIGLLRRY